MDLAELGLSERAYRCLVNAQIQTVEELCLLTARQLLKLPGLGKGTLRDIEEVLRRHARSLHRGEPDHSLLVIRKPFNQWDARFSSHGSDLKFNREGRK